MKKVVFHLGFHRTGTSAVQSFLRKSRQSLLDKSVGLVLREDIEDKHRHFSPSSLVNDSIHDAIIISEENLIGRMPYVSRLRCSVIFYDKIDRLMKQLVKLGQQCDLQIVAGVRRQDKWLEALYFYNVYKGLKLSFGDFLRFVRVGDLDWGKYHKILSEYGLVSSVRYYTLDTYRHIDMNIWVPQQFGLPSDYFDPVETFSANATMPMAGTEVFLAMNKAGIALGDHKSRKEIRKSLWDFFVHASDGEMLTTQQAKEIVASAAISLPVRQANAFDRYFSTQNELEMSDKWRLKLLTSLQKKNDAFLTLKNVSGQFEGKGAA